MQLARFLNSVFKKDGFILVDANSKNYIIGNPKSDNPKQLMKNFVKLEVSLKSIILSLGFILFIKKRKISTKIYYLL